jgi:phosphoesterase RecJ-like protein
MSDTEDLVNEVNRLGCATATVMFTEEPEGVVRVNFRSKRDVDVAQLAQQFGGGGHVRAAGARVKGGWDETVAAVTAAADAAVRRAAGEAGESRRQ